MKSSQAKDEDNICFSAHPLVVQFNMEGYDKLHAKSILIDGRTLILGSFNLDNSGFSTNMEIGLITNDTNIVEEYIHFVRILDKKLVGDFSPISFEEEIINTILLNNRKQDLFDKLRDSIYNNSTRGVDYEIY